jgi:hypothetical protein
MRLINMKASLRAAAAMSALVVTTACTGSQRPAAPSRSASETSYGVVSGFVDVCSGPGQQPPRQATVEVLHAGSVIATVSVIAGDPAHHAYRVRVPAGVYTVRASNWPQVTRTVLVNPKVEATAEFPNNCD